jgi:hypothetical protein
LSTAIAEALAKLPPGDDPRRRILSIELESVAKELDADPCGRPSLVAVLERLVPAVFPGDARLADEEMELDAWWDAMGGRRD